MNKLKLFTENFLVYGLGGIISKVIPLIMVPIVTRIMPDSSYYGISDLSNTVVSFATYLAVMGMYDAMYRMFFEKDDESFKKTVCSTTLAFTLFTSIIIFVIMVLLKDVIAEFFFNDANLAYVVYLSAMAALVGATNSIVSAPTRMQNKRKVFLVTNTISPILSYAVSIPMLLAGYYTIALPFAAVVSGAVMEISFGVMNRKWFSFKLVDLKLLKSLLVIALPLLPEALIYWVFNSSDKVMITNMIGIGAAGVYSVASKLGSCSQLIYTAFAGGWQFFAFSTMNEEKQVENNSIIFEYLGIISFAVTAFICAWSYLIFKIFFTEEYLTGYISAPYLFMAPLLQMLYQVISNQFLVIKKTWPSMVMLLAGAAANILFNYFMIPVMGIEGASIATLLGYVISVVICVVVLCRMKLMVVTKKFIPAVVATVLFMVIWRLFFSSATIISTILALALTAVLIWLYRDDVKRLKNMIKNRKSGEDGGAAEGK